MKIPNGTAESVEESAGFASGYTGCGQVARGWSLFV